MNRRIKKSFVPQQDQSDCGVACLASLIKYYRGSYSFDRLRELSGTSKQGTTLLGLYQAAQLLGFQVDAYEAQMEDLEKMKQPVILHVVLRQKLKHYLVCYQYQDGKYIIGDPAQGIVKYTPEELNAVWQTHALLKLRPTDSFVQQDKDNRNKLHWIFHLVKEDLNTLGLALFLGLIVTVLSFSQAIFSQILIDDILPSKDAKKLIIGLLLLGILLLFNISLASIRSFFLLQQSKDFNTRIVDKFYSALLYLPKLFFDTRKTGDMIARLNDTSRIQHTISYLLSSVAINVLVLLVSLVFVFYYSYSVGLILLGSIPVYIGLAWFYNPKIAFFQREVMEAHALNESNYVDTISGISAIKATGKEPFFRQATQHIYGFFQQKVYDAGKFGIKYNFLSGIISFTVNFGVIGVSAWMVINDTLQLGEMVALMAIASNVLPSVNSLVGAVIDVQEAKVAFDRMYGFANYPTEISGIADPTTNALVFSHLRADNISFRFVGRKQLLHNISFQISKGEMIALLGESGSGKSTILQILQMFYKTESGTITVNKIPWQQVNVTDWRKTIAVVPQQLKIFNGTLLDNICLSNSLEEAPYIIHFCEQYGFAHYFEAFPQGYMTLLGEEGINISGGQQQMVGLARALYQKPQLLLLDEATAAMDRHTENFILDLLERLKDQLGIVMVTHRIKTAYRADQIYILDQGHMVGVGNHSTLMKTENFYSLSFRDLMPESFS